MDSTTDNGRLMLGNMLSDVFDDIDDAEGVCRAIVVYEVSNPDDTAFRVGFRATENCTITDDIGLLRHAALLAEGLATGTLDDHDDD